MRDTQALPMMLIRETPEGPTNEAVALLQLAQIECRNQWADVASYRQAMVAITVLAHAIRHLER